MIRFCQKKRSKSSCNNHYSDERWTELSKPDYDKYVSHPSSTWYEEYSGCFKRFVLDIMRTDTLFSKEEPNKKTINNFVSQVLLSSSRFRKVGGTFSIPDGFQSIILHVAATDVSLDGLYFVCQFRAVTQVCWCPIINVYEYYIQQIFTLPCCDPSCLRSTNMRNLESDGNGCNSAQGKDWTVLTDTIDFYCSLFAFLNISYDHWMSLPEK